MENYNNIKDVVKLESIFDNEYNGKSIFLVNSEPVIIFNINNDLYKLAMDADYFIKIDLLFDIEDFSQDPDSIEEF